MKPLLTTVFALLFICAVQAQNSKTTVRHQVTIEEDGDGSIVTIEKEEAGETTTTILTGEDAEAYIQEHGEEEIIIEEDNGGSIIKVNISSDDFAKFEKEMEKVGDEIEREMKVVAKEIDRMSIDSILNSVGVQIEHLEDQIKYQFQSDDGESKSVIIMNSNGSDDHEEIDVQVEVRTDEEEREERITVQRKSIILEDQESESKDVKLKDLKVFPNPTAGSLNLEFENPIDDQVEVKISDSNGRVLQSAVVTGSGSKLINLSLDSLPSGTYTVAIRQGDRASYKKLILQD